MKPLTRFFKKFILIFFIAGIVGFLAIPRETVNLLGIAFSAGTFSFVRDLRLKLGLDLAGGSFLAYEADMEGIPQDDRESAAEAARATIERRINLFGVAESTVKLARSANTYRLLVELPGVHDPQEAGELIGKTARLDFREIAQVEDATEPTLLITFENTQTTGFSGADFARARPGFDSQTGAPVVLFETKEESAQKFAEITRRLIGQPLVIFLDDTFVSAPIVQQEISGSGQITGQFTLEETRELANLLNSGALPVPVNIVEQRSIESTLGEAAIEKSLIAAGIGIGAILVFMIIIYGRLGFLSIISLAFYGAITISIYKLIPVVLTLPGIAGFILSLGMAVDTNILVFERIKEELRDGKPYLAAAESGFSRAWSSIRDANIATLFIVLILINPLNLDFLHTSGPVRGFAITLGIGVLTGLFTGVWLSRKTLRAVT